LVKSYMDTSSDVTHAIVVMSYMDCIICYCGDLIYSYFV
jgi:hypothetical protein